MGIKLKRSVRVCVYYARKRKIAFVFFETEFVIRYPEIFPEGFLYSEEHPVHCLELLPWPVVGEGGIHNRYSQETFLLNYYLYLFGFDQTIYYYLSNSTHW